MDNIAIDSSLLPFTPAPDMLEFISRLLSFSPISSIRILQTKLTFDVKYFEIWIFFHKWQWALLCCSSSNIVENIIGEPLFSRKLLLLKPALRITPKRIPRNPPESHQRTFIKNTKKSKKTNYKEIDCYWREEKSKVQQVQQVLALANWEREKFDFVILSFASGHIKV